jgi:hypothetical protein
MPAFLFWVVVQVFLLSRSHHLVDLNQQIPKRTGAIFSVGFSGSGGAILRISVTQCLGLYGEI